MARTTRKGLLAIIVTILLISGGLSWPNLENFGIGGGDINISEKGRDHILERHQFGAGVPCKSEFPKEWNSDEIIGHVEKVAANDNLKWKRQGNGYHTAEQTIEGVRVRVVLNKNKSDVVTAYPVNVARNPCPAGLPANDNEPAEARVKFND